MPDPSPADFEAHLRAAPDDVAGWSAYADFLTDRGDPRGEFLRVQLALEDPALPKPVRKRFAAREKELLFAHYPAWMGRGLTKIALDRLGHHRPDARSGVVFRRGWVRALPPLRCDAECIDILATAPEVRWLEHLALGKIGDHLPVEDFPKLAGAPFAGCLKHLTIGDRQWYRFQTVRDLAPVIAALPALEGLELNAGWTRGLGDAFALPFARLRTLSVRPIGTCYIDRLVRNPTLGRLESLTIRSDADDDTATPVETAEIADLAAARNLPSLRSLTIHEANFGDEGCAILAASPVLDGLTHLDLSGGTITDAGVRLLLAGFARRPELRRELVLAGNPLTEDHLLAAIEANVHLSGGPDFHADYDME